MRWIVLAALAACSSASVDAVLTSGNVDGCSTGEHVVWGADGKPTCAPVPLWPPAASGSRAIPATCPILDGSYALSWSTDAVEDVRPAFSVTRRMTVEPGALALDEWSYALGWLDAGHAFAWQPGDLDILEFTLSADCRGGVSGSMTVDLPYVNPGRQVETWTLSGTPDNQ